MSPRVPLLPLPGIQQNLRVCVARGNACEATPTGTHVSGNRELCLWVLGRTLDAHSAAWPGRGPRERACPTHPERGLRAGRPRPAPRAPPSAGPSPPPRTCVVHPRVAGLGRPPTLPLRLLHLRHVEVSLPCQRAHEVDLVLLVDLQPRVGTQLPLLVREGGEG